MSYKIQCQKNRSLTMQLFYKALASLDGHIFEDDGCGDIDICGGIFSGDIYNSIDEFKDDHYIFENINRYNSSDCEDTEDFNAERITLPNIQHQTQFNSVDDINIQFKGFDPKHDWVAHYELNSTVKSIKLDDGYEPTDGATWQLTEQEFVNLFYKILNYMKTVVDEYYVSYIDTALKIIAPVVTINNNFFNINNNNTKGNNMSNIFGNLNISLRPASVTMNGDLAFKTASGAYRSINEAGEFIEVEPTMLVIRDANILMPQFKAEPEAGDILIEGDKTYVMKDDNAAIDLESGVTAKKSVAKNMFFKQAIVYRSMLKGMDMSTIMPMIMLNGGDMSALMPMIMMQQMQGTGAVDFSNVMENPMMMMAMCGGGNPMMAMMMMQMMKGNTKPAKAVKKITPTKAAKSPAKAVKPKK